MPPMLRMQCVNARVQVGVALDTFRLFTSTISRRETCTLLGKHGQIEQRPTRMTFNTKMP